MSNQLTPSDFQTIQDGIVEDMAKFASEHPEIIEAMEVMNISVAEYIQAMDSIRGAQTFSCSSLSQLPTHLPAEIGR